MSRIGPDGNFGPGKVVKELSTEFEDIMPNVRERDDGSFEIVFSSDRPTWGNGQPAKGKQDVYISYVLVAHGRWSAPRNLGDAVNTAGVEQRSTLSADGKRLYFGRDGDIFVSQRSGQELNDFAAMACSGPWRRGGRARRLLRANQQIWRSGRDSNPRPPA